MRIIDKPIPKKVEPNLLLARRNLQLASSLRLPWQGALFVLLAVTSSTAIMFWLNLAPYNVNMVYMLVTLFATVLFGLSAGVITAVIAFLCFDYFFIPPFFTFTIDAFQGWTAVFLFLGTALFANQVAGRARLNNQQAQERAQEITALYELATTVITRIDRTEMLETVLQKVSETLDVASCTLFLTTPDSNGDNTELSLIQAFRVEKTSLASRHHGLERAQAVFSRGEAAFFSGERLVSPEEDLASEEQVLDKKLPDRSDGPAAYLPLASGSHRLGVLLLVGSVQTKRVEFSLEEQTLLEVFANHVALAVEHARLIEETAQLAALRESDHLKSALLASVSHELRTPLTSIKTAVANLLSEDISWNEEEQHEFLTMIEQETDRLNRLISNLLDLSKIEAGVLKPNFSWYYLPEIVSEVVERLKSSHVMQSHPIFTSFAPDIPLTRLDYVQMDQVLTNLLENAAKYSGMGRVIRVQVELKPVNHIRLPDKNKTGSALPLAQTSYSQVILVKVVDDGIGIPPDQLERVFDKFYRVQQTQHGKASNRPGTGIGLTLSKGIIEAHSGQIWAQKRVYGGTIFSFTLPVIPFNQSQELPEEFSQGGNPNE